MREMEKERTKIEGEREGKRKRESGGIGNVTAPKKNPLHGTMQQVTASQSLLSQPPEAF